MWGPGRPCLCVVRSRVVSIRACEDRGLPGTPTSGEVAWEDGRVIGGPGADIAQSLYGQSYEAIEKYVDILASKGVEWGLLGPREVERLWQRHILNSVALEGLVSEGSDVIDVGSGAGLPGIPLAVLRPDLRVRLVEPLLRRSTFLGETVDELGLADRVEVVRGRAEDISDTCDAVTARAVAPLDRLCRWTAHLVREGGEILALKGQSAEAEVGKTAKALSKVGLAAEVLVVRAAAQADPTHVVRVRAVRDRG